MEVAFGRGWDMYFKELMAQASAVTTLEEATRSMGHAFDNAVDVIGGLSDEQLMRAMPEDPIVDGIPKMSVINQIVDHTAHHRCTLG